MTCRIVMAGLVPAIHVFDIATEERRGCPRQARGMTEQGALLSNNRKEVGMKGLFSNGVKAVVLDLLPEFERANGVTPAITWASTNMLMDEIRKGATGDLAILTDEVINDLIRQGKMVAGSRVDLARSAIGIAVRQGASRPDIGSAAALKQTLLSACTISYSKTGISGVYFPTVLERLGIVEQVASKVLIPPSGVPVGEVVAKGEAEIGVQQISELLPVPGIEIIGPLPPELQKVTVFSAGLFTGASEPQVAKALVALLTSAAARPVYQRKGMEPV
jgi:molybdate transport system substrate-binding protein